MTLLKKKSPPPQSPSAQTVVVVHPQPVQVRAHEREAKDKPKPKLRRLLRNPFRGPTNTELEEAELVSDWFSRNQKMTERIREDEG